MNVTLCFSKFYSPFRIRTEKLPATLTVKWRERGTGRKGEEENVTPKAQTIRFRLFKVSVLS